MGDRDRLEELRGRKRMAELQAKRDGVPESVTPEEPKEKNLFQKAIDLPFKIGEKIGEFTSDVVDQPKESAIGAVTGFARGLGQVVNVPGAVIRSGLSLVPGGEEPITPTDAFRDLEKQRIEKTKTTSEQAEKVAKPAEFATKVGLGIGAGTLAAPVAGAGIGGTVIQSLAGSAPFLPQAFSEGGSKQAIKELAINAAIDLATFGIAKAFPGIKANIIKKFAGIGDDAAEKLAREVLDQATQLNSQKLDKAIEVGMAKGVKPTVIGKPSLQKIQQFDQKSKEAVKTIALNKNAIEVLDEAGEAVAHPRTAGEFSQAIDKAKKIIYDQYHGKAIAAGDLGSEFSFEPIAKKLSAIADPNNKKLAPKTRQYAQSLLDELAELQGATPDVVESRISDLNSSLAGYYSGRTDKAVAQIDASVAALMREQLDKQITEATGEGYNALKKQYGALKTIEREVAKRAVVNARKSSKGLLDMTDIFTGSELVGGIMTMNPLLIAKGASGRGLKEVYKALNNPERFINKMFKVAYEEADKLGKSAKNVAGSILDEAEKRRLGTVR